MAVGTGFGLDLSQLDAAIKKADEALKSLAKTGERTSKQINEAFSLAKNGNIQDFISVIERLSNTLGKKGYNQAAQMVREIATETTSAIDRVSRFATLMQTISDGGRSNVKNGAIESLKYQLDEALSRLGVLNERLQFYTKGEGAKAVNHNVVDTSALQDEANKLRVVVELLQRRLESEQALAALKQRSGAIENQQALNTSWQKMEEERTKQLQQQSINAKEANKAYEQAYNDRYQMYAVMYDKMWQEDLKHFERQNANAKSGSQQYAKDYEDRQRYYERWINEQFLREQENNKKTAEAKLAEEKRINQQITQDRIDQLGKESRERLKIEQMIRDTQRRNHEAREKELNDLFREQERQAKAQAKADSDTRKLKYKAYTTSYAGAIYTSDHANTLAKEIKAVKNLEAAREKLKKTDADYHRKLGELNTRIKQHNQNIERATAGTKKLNGALAAVGRGIASAFSVQAIRGYVNQMIKVRGEMELQQKSLQAILQNKDAANEIWQKTIDLAVRSPFRIKDLVTYTKQLAAYRIEADKLYETNKMLADVSAGLGVDMQRLILAFGQVKAANFLRGTELRQFTEAGIPMLDELAKHFNDMNNTALTSADVFEMISKRMVLFEDVEAVFERLTKAGGTFYRMQEIQAETLRGQISNLKDSIDIMLNDMGKANDSTMKFAVKSVKMLVDNYERLVPILKTVISAMAVYKLNAFLAARQTGILTSMLFNMGVAAEKFFLTISKNPWTAITAVILAAAGAVYRYVKALNDVDKAYSDMYRQQSEITSKFFKAKDIDERKRALKDLVEYANKEYSIEVDLDFKGMSDDEVRTEMNRLRQQMIKANAFGATFQKELIKANQETSMGQWWDLINPLIGQGMNKDIDQMGDSYKNLNDLLMNNLSPTIDYLSTQLGKLNKDQRDALESLKAGIGEWKDKDEDMVDYFERIRGNYETLIGLLSKSDNIADKKIARQLKKYQRRYDEAEKEFQTFVDRIDDDIAKLNAEDKAIFLSAAIDDARSEKNWSEFEETQIRKWLEKKYEIELTPKIVKEDKELKAWQDSYNKLFEGKTGWRKIRTKGTSQTQVIEQLNAQYKATEELVKRIQQAGEDSILEGGAYEGENLEKLKKDLADIQEQLNWFGAEAKKDKNKESASIKILQKRINLLKEVNKKYLELEKTFDAVTAKEKVMEAYSDTFREAFAGTGVELDMYKVMTQVIADSKNVGEDMGTALSEGMLAKLKGLEDAGTYIRKASKDIFEQLKKDEGFKNLAYPDIGGGWSIGIASQMWPDGKPVKKGDYWTDEQIWEYSQDIIAEHEKRLNAVLDLHKDIVVTQEQYNALLNQTWQSGTASPVFTYAKDAEKFYDWLKKIDGIPIVRVFQRKRADGTTYNERVKTGKTFDIDVDAIMKQYNELETIHEKMALVMQYTSVRTKAYGDTTQFMIDRALRRSQQFRGDLDIAKQLETVLVRIAGMDFTTTEGMVEALGKLKEIAEKEGPEAKNILSQAISGLEAEIGLRVKKDADKKLNDEIEDLFDQYELTLDLKKLNVPKDLAEGLFGAKYLDLKGLRKALTDRASEFVGTEQQEQYEKFLEKIDEMDRKALVERTKTYLEYAKLTVGERAKIKLEELQKLKEIKETFAEEEGDSEETKAHKKDMRERASSRVKQEAKAALRKLDWDEFQKTDTFTSIFADIDDASDALVNHMIEKIRDFKNEWKDMPLEDVRTMVNKLNELESALAERSPWEAYRNAKDAVKKAREDAKFSFESDEARNLYGKGKSDKDYIAAIQIENAYQEEKAVNAEKEAAAIESILALKTKEREGSVVNLGLTREQMEYTKLTEQELRDLLKTKKGEASTARAVVLANGQVLVQYKNQEKSLLKQKEVLGEVQKMANDLYDAFSGLAEALGADSDSPAAIFADMGMNMLNTVLNTIQLQIQLNAATVAANGLGIAMNTAMGVVGWIVMAIQLVVQAITAIVNYADKQKEKEIERLAKRVEDLKEKFEDLSEAIDEAWSTSQLTAYKNELDQTYKMAIAAQKAIVAARADEKEVRNGKTDSEEYKQWEEAKKELEELEQEYAEATQDIYTKVTGGILDSVHDAAREFTDAWWDAFVETGDGLSGLEENFNEMFLNLAKNQAAMQITGAFADRWKKDLEKYINADDTELTKDEAKKWAEEVRRTMPELSAALEGYLGAFKDMAPAEGAGLSGLQKGIQGITEDQADILAAYWNSVRGYTASIDSKMDLILANLNVSAEDNPMLAQLRTQTDYLNTIKETIRLASIDGGSTALNVRLVGQRF